MKKIINIIGLAIIVMFASCEKETKDISYETNYPNFELEGDDPFNLPIGNDYVEPGFKAIAGGEELEVTTSNNIDKNTLGIYEVIYSATNVDGYTRSTTRTVAVFSPSAPSTDLSGTYVSDMVRYEADGSGPRQRPGLEVNITKVGPGIFYVDDLLGGYYSIAAGYGPAYAMTGYLSLNSDNTLTLLSSFLSGWGDSLEEFNDGMYDPSTGEITWKSIYASGRSFNVTLNK